MSGAPAISADGVFGVVRECEVKCCPVISLLSVARRFIELAVPQLGTPAPPQADIVDRQAGAGDAGFGFSRAQQPMNLMHGLESTESLAIRQAAQCEAVFEAGPQLSASVS